MCNAGTLSIYLSPTRFLFNAPTHSRLKPIFGFPLNHLNLPLSFDFLSIYVYGQLRKHYRIFRRLSSRGYWLKYVSCHFVKYFIQFMTIPELTVDFTFNKETWWRITFTVWYINIKNIINSTFLYIKITCQNAENLDKY